MILCLLGTNPYDFSRLAIPVDHIAKKLKIETFIQLGHTEYIPKNCNYKRFLDKDIINSYMEKADLIISQGGFGGLTDAIYTQKKIIAVPRRIDLKESQDDQFELVKYYETKGYIFPCYEVSKLNEAVKIVLSGKYNFQKYVPESNVLIKDIISNFITKL